MDAERSKECLLNGGIRLGSVREEGVRRVKVSSVFVSFENNSNVLN